MKLNLKLVSIVIFLIIGLFVFLNISNTITFETAFLSLKASVGFFILFCVILSSIATLLFLISMNSTLKLSKNDFKRQLENSKLNHELESSKISQLEEKIKTLEEALKIATKK